MKQVFIGVLFLNLGNYLMGQELNGNIKPIQDSTKISDIQEVEVVGRKENSYKNTNSFSGSKVAVALKDIPQSVGYVTKELILDQGATTVNDVVKNISGVNQYSVYNDFSIRGFRVLGNRNSGNLVNGMRAQTSLWKQQTIANIERVEVIKGPSSALFGNASPGGVINRVTKKPLPYHQNMITTSVGSFSTIKTYGDFTGPLTKDKSLLYRLNLGYETSDSFRDLQGYSNIIVAPSFSFIPTDKTRINVDLFYQKSDGKLDRGLAVFGNKDLYSVPVNKSINASNDFLKEKTINVTVGLTHKFTDNLSFNSTYLLSTYDEDLREHRTSNDFVRLGSGKIDPNKVAMQVLIRNRNFRSNSINNFFNYKINTGDIKHNLVIGYDYFQGELLSGASQIQAKSYLLKNGNASNSFNIKKINDYVLDKNGNPVANVPFFDLTDPNANSIKDISKYAFETTDYAPTLQKSHGIYVQEQIEWNWIKVLLGMRQEFVVDYLHYQTPKQSLIKQNAFLPRVGIVATINPNINIYGTWVKGFEAQSSDDQSNPLKGGPFAPSYSELYETGIKSEWFKKNLSLTLSVFKLTQTGTLYNAGDKQNPELLMQIGKEISQGIEADITGNILPNWSVSTSYSYNDARIKDTTNSVEKNIQKPNTPLHSGNIWSKFIFQSGYLKNLGVGIGFNFVTNRYGTIAKSEYPTIFPGYQLLNGAIYYRINNIQLQINANNIFNKVHWVGGYDLLRNFPGSPRNISATISYKF